MSKLKNQGFAGLADLAHNSVDVHFPDESKDNSASTSESVSQPGKPTALPLIDLERFPSLPAPWSTAGRGETWIWGDFFLTFHTKPKLLAEVLAEEQRREIGPQSIAYYYAMSVFYRADKNPHGARNDPIAVIALEKLQLGAAKAILEEDIASELSVESQMPLMLGLFTGGTRYNLGSYSGDPVPRAMKNIFFETLGERLGLTGKPHLIGDFSVAHGHPETGLPHKRNPNAPAHPIETGSNNSEPKSPSSSSQPVESVKEGTATSTNNTGEEEASSSGIKWFIALGIIVLIGIANKDNEPSNNRPTANTNATTVSRPPPSQTASAPQITSSPKSVSADLIYSKPYPGTNNVHSISELRWCTREGIRIDVMRNLIDSNAGVEAFNRLINDYNSRCSSYRYQTRDLTRAETEVNNHWANIAIQATRDAEKLGMNDQLTLKTQRLMAQLGYNPGVADGIFGWKTFSETRKVQADYGLKQTGLLSVDFLEVLQKANERSSRRLRSH